MAAARSSGLLPAPWTQSWFCMALSSKVAREAGNRAARKDPETLDYIAFGTASPVQPKFVTKSDLATQ